MNFQSLLNKIEDAYSKKMPFVAYRKPNSNVLSSIFQNTTELYFLDYKVSKGFLFAPFDDRERSVLIPVEESTMYTISLPESFNNVELLNINSQSDFDKEKHIKLVKKGVDFINKSKVQKIVLSRKEEFDLNDFSINNTFEKLLCNYENAFVYVWFHPKVGLWLGATPETLVTITNKEFKTMSLAGTQASKSAPSIIWHQKEIKEQQFVTDYIISKLNDLTESLEVTKPYTTKAGHLLHLRSDIIGNLNSNSSLIQLLNVLHPTPAVCGVPKEISKKFIIEHENYNREFYTGYLGEFNINNNSNLFVNLRCMQIKQEQAYIYIGGGITLESIPENEWQETVEKAKIMKKVLLN